MKWTPQAIEVFRLMTEDGHSDASLAAAFGISKQAAALAVHRFAAAERRVHREARRKAAAIRDALIRAEYAANDCSCAELSERFGVTRQRIHMIVRR